MATPDEEARLLKMMRGDMLRLRNDRQHVLNKLRELEDMVRLTKPRVISHHAEHVYVEGVLHLVAPLADKNAKVRNARDDVRRWAKAATDPKKGDDPALRQRLSKAAAALRNAVTQALERGLDSGG